jgi:prepilin-type N-terminal cleavage/methylation domain-containing protein
MNVKRPKRAFTLTEILAALVLASLVLTLLMGLTARIAKTNLGIVQRRPDNTWLTQLQESFQADFESCRSITVSPRQIVLDGYSIPRNISFAEMLELPAAHLPLRVTYEVVELGGQWWIKRTEKIKGSTESEFSKSVLMASGFSGFALKDQLQTDAAPPVLRLKLVSSETSRIDSVSFNLVRHGGISE